MLLVNNIIILIFRNIIIIINFVIIIKFLDKIYKAIFHYFIIVEFIENKFFDFLIIYFNIMKTNDKGIFYLYYLV